MEGGSIREPMIDLVNLLACLTDKGRITLPRFYEDVRELSPGEEKFYEEITKTWSLPVSD
jgi:di- and tripeptidase